MAEHTKTPWEVRIIRDTESDDTMAFIRSGMRRITRSALVGDEDEANLKHIVACVNNCSSINPEAIPKLVEALRRLSLVQWATIRDCAKQALREAGIE